VIHDTLHFDLPLLDEYDYGDCLDVYWDNGTGTVSYAAPLNSRPIPLFKSGVRAQGYGAHPYGLGCPDGRADRAGDFGASVYGADLYGAPSPVVRISVSVPRSFGDRRFGVKVCGRSGDATGTAYEFDRFVASAEPPPVVRNAMDSYAAGSDRVTASWVDLVE